MNDKFTVSTFRLFKRFPDQETARKYLEGRLWPKGAKCPACDSPDRITVRKDGFYRCNPCKLDFTVRTGTIFERSHVPLHKWIYAMYLLVMTRKGISSLQLSKEIGITQKSAWFVLQRLREACGNDLTILRGIVEIDETYIGSKERNKRGKKKRRAGGGSGGKSVVGGMRKRGRRTVVKRVDLVDAANLHNTVHQCVGAGSIPHTGGHSGYRALNGTFYKHETINHCSGEYARGDVSTSSVERMWAAMKRGLHGVCHHASTKYLGQYVDELTFRWNDVNAKRHTMERLDSFVDAFVGCRITHKELAA